MPQFKALNVSPWIATRSFVHDGECRAVISNELDHEFIVFDGEAARLWQFISEHPGVTIEKLSAILGYPENEVYSFIRELQEIHLLEDSSIDQTPPRHNKNYISSARYEGGSQVEASPGGTNLDAEFECQDWALERGFLWSVGWEVTYRCNEACIHCFNPGASHQKGERSYRKTNELKETEWRKMLLEMKNLGVFRLLLTGGEVALHKDFFDIFETARGMGFSVTIFTNGTLFDSEQLDRLIAGYPHRIELTLYSSESSEHDDITNLQGSFDSTLEAARYLNAAGVTVALKMSVMNNTIEKVKEFQKLCEKEGFQSGVDFNLSPGLDGAREPLLQLLPDPLSLIRQTLDPKSPLYIGTPEKAPQLDWKTLKKNSLSICGAGRTTMSISPEGHIYPCNSLPLYTGSIRNEGLEAVWKKSRLGGNNTSNPLTNWQDTTAETYYVCGTFDRCVWCQKCPGMAFLESGDERKPSTVNCRNAAARLVSYTLRSEGKNPLLLTAADLPELALRFSENKPLWDAAAHLETQISLDSVKQSLRQRARITVLSNNPIQG